MNLKNINIFLKIKNLIFIVILFFPIISNAVIPSIIFSNVGKNTSESFFSGITVANLSSYSELNNKQIKNKTKDEFYYDRIIVNAKDNNNLPLLLFFEGGRQELEPNLFKHNYKASLLYQGKTYKLATNFTSSTETISSNGFVVKFNYLNSVVLPTHIYDFTLLLENKLFHFKLDDLNSDFLVKSGFLNHIRYVSAGHAIVEIGGEKINGYSMVDSILSNDRRVPTIEGYTVLRTSHSVTLWDEEKNFYHFDLSDVFSRDIPYESHKWILYKEAKGGAVNKFYEAEVKFNGTGNDYHLTVYILKINKKFTINLTVPFNKSKDKADGFVTGEIKEGSKIQNISGYMRYINVR